MHALGTEFAKRAAGTGVNGIGEEIALRRLDQKGGVIKPSCANGGGGEARARRGRCRDVARPASRAAGEFPAQDVMQARDAFMVGIEKSASVTVVGDGELSGDFHVFRSTCLAWVCWQRAGDGRQKGRTDGLRNGMPMGCLCL